MEWATPGSRRKKNGLRAEALYFIGKRENAMIWRLRLRSDRDRSVRIYPFLELGMMEFMRELQWQCYNKHQLKVSWMEDQQILFYRYGVETQPRPDETPLVYFAATAPVSSFDGDRDEFIGPYRSEENPVGLEEDSLSNSILQGGDSMLRLGDSSGVTSLGRKGDFCISGHSHDAGGDKGAVCPTAVKRDLWKNRWQDSRKTGARIWSIFSVRCRIPEVQRMINIWNPYQAQRNFLFSRNLSYYATGTFRGVGIPGYLPGCAGHGAL